MNFLFKLENKFTNANFINQSTGINIATIKKAILRLKKIGFIKQTKFEKYGKLSGFSYKLNEKQCEQIFNKKNEKNGEKILSKNKKIMIEFEPEVLKILEEKKDENDSISDVINRIILDSKT